MTDEQIEQMEIALAEAKRLKAAAAESAQMERFLPLKTLVESEAWSTVFDTLKGLDIHASENTPFAVNVLSLLGIMPSLCAQVSACFPASEEPAEPAEEEEPEEPEPSE